MDLDAMTRHALSRGAVRPPRLALFAAAAFLVCGTALPAQAQEDTSLTETLLTTLGLVAPTPPDIDYRDRAPLVVPPNAEILPPPGGDDVSASPAWPKDYDEQQQKKQAALEASGTSRLRGRNVGTMSPRKLSPAEMERNARNGGGNDDGGFKARGDNRLSPSGLDFRGWGSIGSDSGDKPLVFTGEPQREALVQPPPGYQTPAPNAPYGTVEKKKEAWTLPNWFDRTQPQSAK